MRQNSALLIAEVQIALPVDQPFSYLIPEPLRDSVKPGVQVIVPFGNRYVAGIVWQVSTDAAREHKKLKYIEDVVDCRPFIPDDVRRLLEWIARYYVCYSGEALKLVNPELNLKKSQLEVRKSPVAASAIPNKGVQAEIFTHLDGEKWMRVSQLEKMLGQKRVLSSLYQLRKKGLVETRYVVPEARRIYRTELIYRMLPEQQWSEEARRKYLQPSGRRSARALELVDWFRRNGRGSQKTISKLGFRSTILKKLVSEQVLDVEEKKLFRLQPAIFQEELPDIDISNEQSRIIEELSPFLPPDPVFKPVLLHGITGSGKTQIYIELIKKVVEAGYQAIVLIPEIVLTPQTLARFQKYFGDRVAMLHSRLSTAEKNEVLNRVRGGEFDIVIGPRSAIFAPLDRLGIIVVDEEHESSYKQNEPVPRYHARDVALYRGYLKNIPVVLGSATPSFESLFNALEGKYLYFHLGQRISSRNLPRTFLVNLKEEWRRTNEPPILSENLILKIESRLVSKEQVMLLQNRRGFSPYILCHDCGYIARCPACDITLTYHIHEKTLRCHYCGHSEAAPDSCPNCGGLDILFKGIGTQKIEQEIHQHFPHARVIRMDQDTTRGKHGHARILEKFRNGEADILLGTKMIAKGLDFERVTLVGIISADQGLHFPDFRAAEKVFQLLVQAAGRSGRGVSSGEVIIQSFDPNHYLFNYLGTHDYIKFFERECVTRKTLSYPPHARLCLVRVMGRDENQVQIYADKIVRYFWNANKERRFLILGPAPAPLFKINNNYRYHILIKQKREIDASLTLIRRLLKEGLYGNKALRKWPVKVQIDVDPIEIL